MYQTIRKNSEFELMEKKSRFIANVIYVENKKQAEDKIKDIKKKFYDARHNCYAYRIIENDSIYEKSSDDGEPSGTAGSPILSILQKNEICNVLVVVTRYFGGILLGTGGLVRAYSGSTISALENSSKIYLEKGININVFVDYANLPKLQYYCKKNNIFITNTKYEEDTICCLELTNSKMEKMLLDIENKILIIKQIKIVQEKYIKILEN